MLPVDPDGDTILNNMTITELPQSDKKPMDVNIGPEDAKVEAEESENFLSLNPHPFLITTHLMNDDIPTSSIYKRRAYQKTKNLARR